MYTREQYEVAIKQVLYKHGGGMNILYFQKDFDKLCPNHDLDFIAFKEMIRSFPEFGVLNYAHVFADGARRHKYFVYRKD